MANMLFNVPDTYNNSALAGGRTQQNYRLAVPITSYGTDFPEGRCDAIGFEWTGASGGSVTAISAGSAVKNSDGTYATVTFTSMTQMTQAVLAGKNAVMQIGLDRIGAPVGSGFNMYALYL